MDKIKEALKKIGYKYSCENEITHIFKNDNGEELLVMKLR